ncbi:hypothetical protein [Catenulispora rubra]|uniref:hypothetical protein n=1 Tax=Catenulispora rubra TaxID=280293 RepID=UPI00189230FC|nr:hypothetical protein [Catenulispora rubra]
MPDGISAVVQAEPVCVAEELEVDGAVVAELDAVELPPAVLDAEPGAEPPAGLEPDPDEDVVPAELVVPTVDPPLTALFEEVLVHPVVRATAPSAPAATKTEIRFMEPNLSG